MKDAADQNISHLKHYSLGREFSIKSMTRFSSVYFIFTQAIFQSFFFKKNAAQECLSIYYDAKRDIN